MRLGSWVCVTVLLFGGPLGVVAAHSEPLKELEEQLGSEPFRLSADSLHYELDQELYVARGNVHVEQTDRSLRADWVAFNRRTGRGVASGNVELEQDGDVLKADFVEFELDVWQGQVRGGVLESADSHFRATAEKIEKIGENQYAFRHGRFTTCRCEEGHREPWAIAASRAELEVEGYATARNARFEVLGCRSCGCPGSPFR